MNKALYGFIAGRRRRASAALCIHAAVVLAGVCVARSVLAQAPPPVSEAAAEHARVLFKEGLDLLDGARYVEALDRFQRAYSLWKNPKILLNVATTLRALGQNADAATAYALYLETAEPDSAHRAEVADILRELESRRADVAPAEPQRIERRSEPSRPNPQRAAPAAPRPDAREAPARPRFARRSRLGVLARADFDATSGGAAGAGGIVFEPLDFLRVTGGAVISAHRGAWVGLECSPFRGPVRPVLGTSAPIFFAGEAYAGVSGELGVRFVASARLAPFVRAAIAHFPSVPSGYARTLFVPSAGLEVGL